MLRNGVNYKGLYGNLRTCFGIENKWHELKKKMAYLVSSVSCQCFCAVLWPFQRDLVGFRLTEISEQFQTLQLGPIPRGRGPSRNYSKWPPLEEKGD